DEKTGRLTPGTPPKLPMKEYLGPRHMAFHPTLTVAYVCNEQNPSVTAYQLDMSTGALTPFQTARTIREGEKATPADVHVAPSGKFVYVSNRGHDSIACFAVEPTSGRLTFNGTTPTEPGPRTFSLTPDGRFLVAAGLDSGRLGSYRIDE